MPLLSFEFEAQRMQHPEAKLIPKELWIHLFHSQIDESLLTLIKLNNAHDAIKQATTLPYNNKEQIWLCIAIVYSELSEHDLLSLADNLSLKRQDTFLLSAKIGFLNLIKLCLAEMSLDDKKKMIGNDLFAAFRWASAYGHKSISEWLLRELPEEKEAMIKANDFHAFRAACINNHQEIAEWLLQELPNKKEAMIKENNFYAIRWARIFGHQTIAASLLQAYSADESEESNSKLSENGFFSNSKIHSESPSDEEKAVSAFIN